MVFFPRANAAKAACIVALGTGSLAWYWVHRVLQERHFHNCRVDLLHVVLYGQSTMCVQGAVLLNFMESMYNRGLMLAGTYAVAMLGRRRRRPPPTHPAAASKPKTKAEPRGHHQEPVTPPASARLPWRPWWAADAASPTPPSMPSMRSYVLALASPVRRLSWFHDAGAATTSPST